MAADNVSGYFIIYNAANTNYVMDVSQGGMTDGTNVQVWTLLPGSEAQIFDVNSPSERPASQGLEYLGSTRIISSISGKYLDVDNASTAVGTNVQTWTNVDPNWQGQRLKVVETGNTVTIKGKSYPTYWISMSNATDKVFAPTSLSNGGNVQLASKNTSVTKQEWAFVDAYQGFECNTIYEIRSLLDTRMTLDIDGNGTVNGTNLQLFDVNGTNAQRFYFQESGSDPYYIRCLNSGKYLTVAPSGNENDPDYVRDGDNVYLCSKLAESSSPMHYEQLWWIEPIGTKTINGIECQIVRFCSNQFNGGPEHETRHYFYMDVTAAQTTNQTNVQVWSDNHSDAQKFVLYPTHQVSGPTGSTKSSGTTTSSTALPSPSVSIPTPTGLYIADAVGDDDRFISTGSGNYRYPYWSFSDNWNTSGPNHFRWRYRHRYMGSLTNAWEPWSSWTSWRPPTTTVKGNKAWVNTPVGFEYDYDDYKNCEFEFQVRCATYTPLKGSTTEYGTRLVVGTPVDKVINWYKYPTISFTAAGWSPDGIRLGVSTDYAYGTTDVRIDSVKVNGKNILSKAQTYKFGSRDSSVFIPANVLTAFPADGATLTIKGKKGYEQNSNLVSDYTLTATITYDAGSTSVEPTFVRQGVRLYGIAPDLGTTRMWLGYDGELIECDRSKTYTPESGYVAFDIMYPIGKPYEVFTSSSNAAGTEWGTDYTARTAEKTLPFHGFVFDGGSAYLENFASGGETYTESNEREYEADMLDSRKYESVSYAPTTKSHLTVTGIISPTSTSTVDDFDALLAAGHATYRSPDGQMFDVAVTGVSKTVHNNYTEISVNFVKETV